tara:strand:- start:63 stop:356 length:294 start_codon:yes stop_codon:yes gene_type:complete
MTSNRGRIKFVRAMTELNEIKEYDPDLIRELQEAFCEAIDDYLIWLRSQGIPDLLLANEPKGEKLDPDMMTWLQTVFKDLLAGHNSPFLEPTKQRGG